MTARSIIDALMTADRKGGLGAEAHEAVRNAIAFMQACEDAQPVAVSTKDMAEMTAFANNHGTIEDWAVWCRIRSALTTNPAPDALRVAVEALEKIANLPAAGTPELVAASLAEETLAALQAEQGAK